MTTTEEAQPLTDDEISRALDGDDQNLRSHDTDQTASSFATPNEDPQAPYGRFANGNPRKYPAGSNGSRPGRKRAPRPPRSKPARKPSARGPDYETVIAGLFQALTLPLIVVSPLDAVTMVEYGPEMAQAGAYAAEHDASFAAKLDKLGTIGPFAMVFTVGAKMITQVLCNHGLIPPVLGAVPRERMADRARQMFAQMRDRGAHDAPAV